MQAQSRLITLQAITFLHPGTGQTTGVVDLPVQREVHTGYPMYASSGLKGSLRDKAEQLCRKKDAEILFDSKDVEVLFGSSVNDEDKSSAGAFSITDARILAFPVRSLQQVFVWVTCPMVIQRLLRDTRLINLSLPISDFNGKIDEETAWVTDDSPLKDQLILEDVNFAVSANTQLKALLELFNRLIDPQAGFDGKRLAVIPDQDFKHLVRYATQVSARIQLNDRKTTDGGGGNLWYEETLPPETLMYALALCHKPRKKETDETAQDVADKLQKLLADKFLQIGGNETVGQGWCCVKITGGQ